MGLPPPKKIIGCQKRQNRRDFGQICDLIAIIGTEQDNKKGVANHSRAWKLIDEQ